MSDLKVRPPVPSTKSCIHQAGDDVVYRDGADGAPLFVNDAEHAEIVFVEELEDIFLAGIRGDTNERLGLEFGHALFGSSKEHARNGNGAGELRALVNEDDGVELFEVQVLLTHPVENFVAGGLLADEDEFGVHHAPRSGGIEGEKFADFLGFLVG